ncbi:MAG: hypothetical protein KBS69_02080 [Bacteroidales bacterium]|nr:hypothetical protein [Candidatus Colicola caccequi]
MNRIVLIGNGFDLAHGLKTSYRDFINWYWEQRLQENDLKSGYTTQDDLCTVRFSPGMSYDDIIQFSKKHQDLLDNKTPWQKIMILQRNGLLVLEMKPFFTNIMYSVESKNWVDIEIEYYKILKSEVSGSLTYLESISSLNEQLEFLQRKLVEYLLTIEIDERMLNPFIREIIYEPIDIKDISIEGRTEFVSHVDYWFRASDEQWKDRFVQYAIPKKTRDFIPQCREMYKKQSLEMQKSMIFSEEILHTHKYPDQIYLLSFNYTSTALQYWDDYDGFGYNYIHGKLKNDSNPIIFGYGDELDEKYKQIVNQNDNTLLSHFKSIRYLETDNYKKILTFIDSAPFQIYIMGHSCGNSDRTLLNTLFEHKNCVSIKPFYHIDKEGKDNYMEIVQNIARNFTDMKLMRDRVVNKTYTKAFSDDRH